ncbi:MAG: hypothetical protein IJ501_00835 [Bacilli bacterium]|nr:hypothetical protein [Bacilli bacterium]
MEEEIKKLNLEIETLKERISILERIEQGRKIKSIIKITLSMIIIIIMGIVLYNFYQKLIEFYNSFQVFF